MSEYELLEVIHESLVQRAYERVGRRGRDLFNAINARDEALNDLAKERAILEQIKQRRPLK